MFFSSSWIFYVFSVLSRASGFCSAELGDYFAWGCSTIFSAFSGDVLVFGFTMIGAFLSG